MENASNNLNYDIFFQKFYRDFQEYTYKNQVLIAASGFAVGIVTTDFIKSIIHDILKPLSTSVYKIFVRVSPLPLSKYPILYGTIFVISNIIAIITIWIVSIFVSFFVIEYILNRKIIGLSSVMLDKEKDEYIKEKIESKTKNNIIPNAHDREELKHDKTLLEKYKTYDTYMNYR
jgi:large-conductance mechanosensitive channel